jgi:uncharacterized membrane protein
VERSLRPSALPIAALALLASVALALPASAQQPPAQTKKPPAVPAPQAALAAPQSTHFPILLLAFGPASGTQPEWSIRIGQKGPERLDRPGYPPLMLDPGEVNREGTSDAWTYRAKDAATGADVSVHLTREPCSADTTGAKYTFSAVAQHAQIGALTGCARIAAELFPKITNQTADTDEGTKPAPLPADIIKFQIPTDTAYLNPAGRVVLSIGKIKKIVAPEGSDLAMSHDGKKLLFTRSDTMVGAQRTIVLYDSATGRSQDLVHGQVHQPFWSPDDSRIAYLNQKDEKWELWTFPAASPGQAAPVYTGSVNSLHGWIDAHTLLVSDMENAYWIQDDGKLSQSVSMRQIYGNDFDISGSDTIRINPINSDLFVVSAPYTKPATGAPTDAMGVAAGFFFYELRSKRRVDMTPPEQWARHAEWSRDGVQIFYTRRVSAASALIYRMLWDGSQVRRFQEGTELVVGR